METTFLLAQQFGTTPFFIFEQDTDDVIAILNHLLERAEDNPKETQGAAKRNTEFIKVNDNTATGGWW